MCLLAEFDHGSEHELVLEACGEILILPSPVISSPSRWNLSLVVNMMHGLGYLILVVFFASSTTTTTARLTLAAVVVTSTSATTLGCAFIEWSFSSSREVLAQLYYRGELVMCHP